MSFTVALVGRPNVGKSTLFNRLIGKNQVLVDPTPGVTRDRVEGDARIGGLAFTVIDTAGLADGKAADLERRLLRQTETAVQSADLALMLIDAKGGLTALDRHFADWLRRQQTPVLLVANKCEGLSAESFASEAWALGLGPPIPISAQNGEGLADLADMIEEHMPAGIASPTDGDEDDPATRREAEPPSPLRLAVVGRPNVGKSSLINRMIQDERLLTGPEPGLTRDAVKVSWSWKGRQIELVDTAGLRRRTKVGQKSIERLSGKASLAAIRTAHVVLLMVDATTPLEKQDLIIANRAIDAGSAVFVAANKWDLVDDPKLALRTLRDRIELRLPQIKGVVCLPISVRTGKNIDRLLDEALALEATWSKRISTAMLNRWLEHTVDDHAPPMSKGRRVRIRYGTQVATKPPTFALFASQTNGLPDSYLRYLTNSLRTTFDLAGVPIRLLLRTGNNPYAK